VSSLAPLPTSDSGESAIDVARRCAREGGAIALGRFRGAQQIDVKGHRNIVTDTDVAVELHIKTLLTEAFADHGVLSEETAPTTDPSRGWTWVIDPIDGTKNYAMGIPFWCVNVALCRDGEPLLGVTYDAVHDECFEAIGGEGATCNGRSVRSSERPDVLSSVICIDLGYDDAKGSAQLDLMRRIFPNTQGIRITGSAALGLAYAAAGRVDLYTHMNVSPWDIAAGIVLVREARGTITDRNGGPIALRSAAFAAGGRSVHADFMSRYAGAMVAE
jgi:myo-inositol-1(or 4)-monophosphatase